MRAAALIIVLGLLLMATALGGCGSDSADQPNAGGESTATSPESSNQSFKGFPGAGNPNTPNVTTTAGKPATESKGQAGGGSSATCIGC